MKSKIPHLPIVLFFFLAAGLSPALAQTGVSPAATATAQQATLTVQGEVAHPLTLNAAYLTNMKRTTCRAKDRDQVEHAYAGVALSEILQKAGVTLGQQLRGENMTKYLLARSGDGYEVLFSLPELDSTFSDRVIILADQMDGHPLPSGKGPFRIIVPGEKKPARWIWEVTTLTIKFAKD